MCSSIIGKYIPIKEKTDHCKTVGFTHIENHHTTLIQNIINCHVNKSPAA